MVSSLFVLLSYFLLFLWSFTGLENKASFSFFNDSNGLFLKWLYMATMYDEFLTSHDSTIFNARMALYCEWEEKIANMTYMNAGDPEQRPLLFIVLETFGTSIEFVCASICLIKAKMWIEVCKTEFHGDE